MPIVHRSGGPRIDIVQMGRYGVEFVDEETALGICRSVELARELGGRVVERARANSRTRSLGRGCATSSRD